MHKTLSSIVQKGSSSIKLSDVSSSGKHPVFGASGLVGYLDTFQTDVESVAIIKDGAGVGRSQIIPPYSSVLGTMQLIKPNTGIKASYIKYLVDSMHLGDAYTGATIPHIYYKDYGEKRIPDHSEFERRNICKVLDSIVEETNLLQHQVCFLDEQVKSLFNEMFANDKDDHVPLKDLCTKITDGEHGSVPRIETGHIFLSAKNILSSGVIDQRNISFIDDDWYNKIYRRCGPQKNDILMTTTGTIGNVAIVVSDPKFVFDRGITLLRPRESVSPVFLANLLRTESVQAQMQEGKHGSALKHFFINQVERLSVFLPNEAKQKSFAKAVTQINKLRFKYLLFAENRHF